MTVRELIADLQALRCPHAEVVFSGDLKAFNVEAAELATTHDRRPIAYLRPGPAG